MADIPVRLTPDDVFTAEMAQELVDDANSARERVLVAHRRARPNAGSHVSLIEPIATFRYDLPPNPNARDIPGTLRFSAGLAGTPTWNFGAAPFVQGAPMFWMEFELAGGAKIWGLKIGVGWKEPSRQTQENVYPFTAHQGSKGWVAWPRFIDDNSGDWIPAASTPRVDLTQWVTVAVYGDSPWR
jgi:hypothetical protein